MKKSNDLRGEAFVSWGLGLIYAETGDLEQAIPLLQKCVDYEKKINHPQASDDAAFLDSLISALE